MNPVVEIIEELGGTAAVARMCNISPPSVSEWKARGTIPDARLQYLMLLRPDASWSLLGRKGQVAEGGKAT